MGRTRGTKPLGIGVPVAAAAALCAALLSGCGGTEEKPDLADQDRFLGRYVSLLNASDEPGLADLLRGHPNGGDDARARIAAYGGQDWDVTWKRTSEFPDVWSVRLTGTAGDRKRPVEVVETVNREDGHWSLTPLDGVVPKPSGAADTTRPK
ncbi:hypothetical protein GCM10010497_05170 [Streptomyces cinereoruber]|uniref:DUF3828 domain-containing protein n=1 Tax=Streptomyces cinereoruber TaxID=67260 RepID=A0AAV4KAW7_9ACTN|nr:MULTISPECIES: hypothetical protein [Streptomyces]AVH95727.1 hypothetical protein C5L38_12140 [Streptomyces sp. WAC00288]KYG54400.1 hypothetical protein AWI43_07960 [Streptomyces sp. WAC04657]MBB4157293.1 hypothetical protein [Streptomyces cinereoruber]MBY8814893.1 hypothetical protein [Streptomyces cinereoruber]NIH59609.1 hypothetical protein [Streptomyces cinereoruber]